MLRVRDLSLAYRFRDTVNHALRGVDLDIAKGEFFVLLGPSGCGKTTMLRSLAGLERPDGGTIDIDGEPVFDGGRRHFVPPDRRPIGMVFQSYAVWPHMDVFENVAFPLREGVRRLDRAALTERVGDVLDMLGLSAMADRPVTTLSGGQQQRVALARALALRPKVLLMDEPLSNLDYKLQVRLRGELRTLIHRLGVTTVYVTHNQGEALETGDRIAVMNHGHLVQTGTPREIYQQPADEFVARFIGEMNLLPARFADRNGERMVLESPLGRMEGRAGTATTEDGPVLLGIRPEDLRFLTNGDSQSHGANVIRGNVTAAHYVGDAMVYEVRVNGALLRAKTHHTFDFAQGEEVTLYAAPDHCMAIPPSADPAGADEEGALFDETAYRDAVV